MRHIVGFLLLSALGLHTATAAGRPIRSVNVDRQSLNVAASESATVTIDFGQAGRASVVIVDRDGYPVRALLDAQPANGSVTLQWDGRDDSGRFVADEAYSLKIDWRGPGGTDTYFPANEPAAMSAIEVRSYDRRAATLAYNLSRASRVHIQAGTAAVDPKTKKLVGPVMKTLVNREPRVNGTIAEHWNGYDESGRILPSQTLKISSLPSPRRRCRRPQSSRSVTGSVGLSIRSAFARGFTVSTQTGIEAQIGDWSRGEGADATTYDDTFMS